MESFSFSIFPQHMKRLITSVMLVSATCLAIAAAKYFLWPTAKSAHAQIVSIHEGSVTVVPPAMVLEKLASKSTTIEKYCKANGYNSSFCFMIDMSLPSRKQRFFIYNLKRAMVLDAGLVTHGAGSIGSGGQLSFSNTPGSNCTSLGKYKIGKDFYGKFGLAYKLHGLERGNSMAFKRAVVLHAHDCVPAHEIYPLTICPSLGCPTVSTDFLQTLKQYIDGSAKPVLLYIYN